VLVSSYTRKAVELLSAVNDQVHIVSQDADGDVATREGLGVLAAYDRILREMGQHPVLTVGGYRFDTFEWGELAGTRTDQLTVLANTIDRAIRQAIATGVPVGDAPAQGHPQMLYPTEPNLLIKAWDRNGVRGIFQNAQNQAELQVENLWGVQSAEGRHARNRLMEHYGGDFSVEYRPDASVPTSPAPDVPGRGLTITPEDVGRTARGDFPPGTRDVARRSHPAYAAIMQSQSFLSAETLARELAKSTVALDEGRQSQVQGVIRDRVFVHVEETARLMAENPHLTAQSPEVTARIRALEGDLTNAVAAAGRRNPAAREVVERAHGLAQQIIAAMTADGLREVWSQLKSVLDAIMTEERQGQGGSR
jgi:hypothetical protein